MKIRKAIGWGLVSLPIVLLFVAITADMGVAWALIIFVAVIVLIITVCAGLYLALKDDERKHNGG